jgi:O-acetylhomoserine (thiol)-lyase
MYKDFEYYNTMLVQSIADKVGPTAPTITPSASFGYKDAYQAEEIFAGSLNLPLYARVGNPTNAKLESVVSKIEEGFGAIATSSGMGALHLAVSSFLKSGDEILCVGGFFGGTYTLVNETLKRFGIKNSFCQSNDIKFIENKLKNGIKVILLESVSNPTLRLPDIGLIATLCKKYDTLLIVDNTTTPLLLKPLELGADIVIHSTTKNMSGHSAALGGIAVFRKVDIKNDKLLNEKFSDIHPMIEKYKEKSFIAICKKRALRDIGMSANAFGSFLTLLGLETLSLRIQRVNENVNTIVKALSKSIGKHIKISHPSMREHVDHEVYKKYFPNGCGPLFTIDFGNKQKAFAVLNKLKLVTLTANIGDNRTLALHMNSTIYKDFDNRTKQSMGITEGLVRVSVGIENPRDIIDDFTEAMNLV